jgi:glycosyltransferase involved in cell wall biosynthesis
MLQNITQPQVSTTLNNLPVSITVVIPCYNSAQFLMETVNSVLQQKGCDFEIMLVDDGSSDATSEIISQLVSRHPHVMINRLYQKNQGVAAARNYGIRQAKGRYIFPLDADDLIGGQGLKEAANLLDTDPKISVVYGDRQDFGDIQAYWPAGKYALEYLKYFNQFSYCCMYRKSIWQELGGYSENVDGFDDWDFWIAMLSNGYQGAYIAKPLLQHRRHSSSQLWGILDRYESLFSQIILNNEALYSVKEKQAAQQFIDTGKSSSTIRLSKRIFIEQYYKKYPDLIREKTRSLTINHVN